MITLVGYIDMLKPKSAIHRLPRTSTPLGDILHLTEKANISGKIVSKDSFVQLYANKTKYIPLSGTVK